jgi:hypothetical protein
VPAEYAERRKKLAGEMLLAPMSHLEDAHPPDPPY